MKKKTLKEINDIIEGMTDLDTKLAQQLHYVGEANKDVIIEWFGKLTALTSRLNTIYKKESGIR